jgi:hypothetical protein
MSAAWYMTTYSKAEPPFGKEVPLYGLQSTRGRVVDHRSPFLSTIRFDFYSEEREFDHVRQPT